MITLQTQAVLVPKQVYVGDRAELRCSFFSEYEGFKNAVKDGPVNLSLEGFLTELDFSEYEIREVNLVPSGINYYNLIVSFVPWKTGGIQFPDYDLGKAVQLSLSGNGENSLDGQNSANYFVHFDKFSIVSVTETQGITALKEYSAPLLLPGTVYKLYSTAIVLVILLIFIIRLVIMHKKVGRFVRQLILKHKYGRNKKQCVKKLMLLKKTELSSHDFGEQIQKIIRSYLEFRFEYPFTKTVTSEMTGKLLACCENQLAEIEEGIKKLDEKEKTQAENSESSKNTESSGDSEKSANNGELDGVEQKQLALIAKQKEAFAKLREEKELACSFVGKLFERTDFLRYSSNSDFAENEKNELLESIVKNIELLEKVKLVVESGGGNA
ncbi:MAG: hypothetical protein MJ188_05800 [Treponema sp.]|nr:hypothetical protein [Treponema sp.]